MTKELSIGGVISTTADIIRRSFPLFFSLALAAEAPSAAYSMFTTHVVALDRNHPALSNDTAIPHFVIPLIGALIQYAFNCLLQASLAHGSVSLLSGRKASFAGCAATGLRSFFPIMTIAILSAVGTLVGFAALVLPGIVLWIGWSVVIPVRVVEGRSIFKTFSRSWQLTSGNPGTIFGLLVILAIGSVVIRLPLFFVQILTLPLSGLLEGLAINEAAASLADAFTSMVGATLAGVVYYELRSVKEGIGPEALAAVFD